MPSTQSASLERKFVVNGMSIAAQEWGMGNKNRVIALHGWLDNSASFEAIAPLINDSHIIALDFAGNGESDHRSQHGAYNIWDDLLDILAIADELAWDSFKILSHSRGAFVGMLLAATMPERVEKLLMLDGALLPPSDEASTPKNLSRYLHQQRNNYQRPSRIMSSIEEVVERRIAKIDLTASECLSLAERSVRPAKAGGYVWRHDPRAVGGSAFKFSKEHQQAFLSALQMPCLIILANNGLFKSAGVDSMLKEYSHIMMEFHDGGHHMHMEDKHSASLAARASEFFSD